MNADNTRSNRGANVGTGELRDYVKVFRRFWVGEAATVLVVIMLAAGWTALQPRVYEATASGLTQATAGDDLGLAYAGESLAKSRAESYAKLAASESVAIKAAAILDDGSSVDQLLSRITITLPTDTAIIQVAARASSAPAAAKLANAWVAALAANVEELEKPEGQIGAAALRFVGLAEARPPATPASPNVPMTLALAAVAGILLAVIYALVRHHFDRRIRSSNQIETLLGVPVLGTVPASPVLMDRHRVVADSTLSSRDVFSVSESLRELRTNLAYVDVDRPVRVVVVTSSVQGEGKSTLTANLADAMAASGQNVIVVDCDLRRPTQTGLFGLREGAGLAELLSGKVKLEDALQQPSDSKNLRVIAAGRTPPNPSEMLGSKAMAELLLALSEFAFVLLDAPPLLPVTDAAVLSVVADGTIITVGARQTTVEQLEKAASSLRRVNGRILGVVLNKVPQSGIDSAEYGYYERDYYSANEILDERQIVVPPESVVTEPTRRRQRA